MLETLGFQQSVFFFLMKLVAAHFFNAALFFDAARACMIGYCSLTAPLICLVLDLLEKEEEPLSRCVSVIGQPSLIMHFLKVDKG